MSDRIEVDISVITNMIAVLNLVLRVVPSNQKNIKPLAPFTINWLHFFLNLSPETPVLRTNPQRKFNLLLQPLVQYWYLDLFS